MSATPIQNVFSQIKFQTRRKGIDIIDLFHEMDPKDSGFVIIHRFRKVLNTLQIQIEESEFQDICRGYMNEKGMIEYKRFLDMFSTSTKIKFVDSQNNRLREFKNFLLNTGISFIDAIKKYDRMKVGSVSIDSFFSAFGNAKEVKGIVEDFALYPEGSIHYIELAELIESIPTSKIEDKKTLVVDKVTENQLSLIFNSTKAQGIDVYHSFSKYDKYKKGFLPKSTFCSVLASFGSPISPQNIDSISNAFLNGENVNYIAFCTSLETHKNTKTVTPPPKEMINVEGLIQRFRTEVTERHSLLSSIFENNDPFKTNLITEQMFLQILKTEDYSLTIPEQKALINEFSDRNGKIRYVDFINQLNISAKSYNKDIDRVINLFKGHILSHRIMLRPLCNRFDDDKDGFLLFSQLLAVFRTCEFDVSPYEADLFKFLFCKGSNWIISIEEFCNKCDVYSPPEIVSEVITETINAPKRVLPDKIIEALTLFVQELNSKQIDMKNEFQRYSMSTLGLIRLSSFRAALISLGFLSSYQIELFTSFYHLEGSSNANYFLFLSDIKELGMITIGKEFNNTLTQEVHNTLKQFAYAIKSTHANIDSMFFSYDTFKNGTINIERLNSIFTSLGVNISIPEFDSLCQTFADHRSKERISYKKLLEQIRLITEEDISELPIVPSSYNDLDYVNVMNTIREKIHARRMRAYDAFSNLSSNIIPQTEFRDRFKRFQLIIREPDLQKILRRFQSNVRGDVNWTHFCNEIENK